MHLLPALLAVAGLSGLSVSCPTASPAPVVPTKIMPLGDSITGGPGCWRAPLWQRLQSSGYTNIDFVGTLPGGGCGTGAYDGDNEGHGGYLAINVANQNLLTGWLSATHPDVVIMHFGTNDVWNNVAPDVILAAFSKLLQQMRADNPKVKLLVAQILPMNPNGCADCGDRVKRFNAAIPEWAKKENQTASPVYVVDQWTGFNTATDAYDGVHPNDSGNTKIANVWYEALVKVLKK